MNQKEKEDLCCSDSDVCSIECKPEPNKEENKKKETKCDCGGCC